MPIKESKGFLNQPLNQDQQFNTQNQSNKLNSNIVLNKRTKQNEIIHKLDGIFKDLLKKPEFNKLFGIFGKTINGEYNFDMDMLLENGDHLVSSADKDVDELIERSKKSLKKYKQKKKESSRSDQSYVIEEKKKEIVETDKKQTSLLGMNYMKIISPIRSMKGTISHGNFLNYLKTAYIEI